MYYATITKYEGVDGNGGFLNKLITLHRFIMNFPDRVVDHENNNSLDCRKSNLRITSKSNNCRNRKSKNSNNKSGYRNVSLIEGLYVVQLMVDGRNKRLKSFKNADEAGVYAELMREQLYGDYAGKS